MVSDQDRRMLYDGASEAMGERPASILMELLPPVGWADVARQSDLVAIRGEMAEFRGELRAQLPKLIAANMASMVGVSGLVLAAAAVV